jgi:pimeloyl-ACP methyl ester carboxylesterase
MTMLSFSEQGRGPALVFLHAYPLDHSMWQKQVEAFSHHYRVVTPDVFGFGGSQPPRPWTMPEMGEALLELLNHLEIDRCTLAGLSMGGYISIPFALAHPDRLDRLVLAHTRARADSEAEKATRNDMIAALKKDGAGSLPDKMIPRLVAANAPEEVRKFVRDSIMRTSAEACIHAVKAMRDRVDQTANISKITCPTLVIAGDADAIIKVEDSENLAAALPNGELKIIAGTGHLSNLENPAAFYQALDEF